MLGHHHPEKKCIVPYTEEDCKATISLQITRLEVKMLFQTHFMDVAFAGHFGTISK